MKKLFVFLFIVTLAFFAKYDINITISKEREANRAAMLESAISFIKDYNPGSVFLDLWIVDLCAEGDVHDSETCPKLREKY